MSKVLLPKRRVVVLETTRFPWIFAGLVRAPRGETPPSSRGWRSSAGTGEQMKRGVRFRAPLLGQTSNEEGASVSGRPFWETSAELRYSEQSVSISPIDHQALAALFGVTTWMRTARIASEGKLRTVWPEAPGLVSTGVPLKVTPSCDV